MESKNDFDMGKTITDFVADVKKSLIENNFGDNYCIIVYTFVGRYSDCRRVKFIYKTIEDFKNRFEKEVLDIDEKYGIDLELWIFD